MAAPCQNGTDRVLYVYDRVCPKEVKKRQIYNKYGVSRRSGDAPKGRRSNAEKIYGAGIDPQRYAPNGQRRVDPRTANRRRENMSGQGFDPARSRRPSQPSGSGRTSGERRAEYKSYERYEKGRNNSHSYNYRPGRVDGGGAVARNRSFKLVIDRIVNLFETIDERGRRDESIAKRNAIYGKKLYEYRHAISTALLLVMITAVFFFAVYKFFFVITDITVEGNGIYTTEEIIAASGIVSGDNLYSFRASEIENAISFRCPYIKIADIHRTIPKYVSIAVEEESPKYICDIYGDKLLLSSGLRVLGQADPSDVGIYTVLILPAVDYSVEGRVIEFENKKHENYIRSVLSDVSESAFGEDSVVGTLDLSDEHNITMTAYGKYLFKIGEPTDCAIKLRMADKTINFDSFDRTSPARIDLSKVGEATVRYDLKLEVE